MEATVASGHAVNIAALARTAGVSRRFIYDHPELRAEAERRASEIADRHAGALVASARVTAASLRADLENAKATTRRLEADLTALRGRLGLVLGQEVLADASGQAIGDTMNTARLDELEQALFQELASDLRPCSSRRGQHESVVLGGGLSSLAVRPGRWQYVGAGPAKPALGAPVLTTRTN